jgi:hypothetical protein
MPLTLATNHRRKYMSNTSVKEPAVHWGFSAEIEKIDIQRILNEAEDAGLTLFSVSYTSRIGPEKIFFVKIGTNDHAAVKDVIDHLDSAGEGTRLTDDGAEPGGSGQWAVFACEDDAVEKEMLEHVTVARKWYGRKKHRVAVVGY